jgi:hypothetical protein
MKNFLTRILLAAAVTLVAFAPAPSARAQRSDEEPASATPRQPQSSTAPSSSQEQAPLPAPDLQTQEALAFTGRVVQEQSQFVLKDPVTKMSYQFDDQSKAKPYLGKQVKVIGKLEMNSNTIHIDRIEPLS